MATSVEPLLQLKQIKIVVIKRGMFYNDEGLQTALTNKKQAYQCSKRKLEKAMF
jgi:hypothetical protein